MMIDLGFNVLNLWNNMLEMVISQKFYSLQSSVFGQDFEVQCNFPSIGRRYY